MTLTGFPVLRWHQTADIGAVPNPALPKVFMAVGKSTVFIDLWFFMAACHTTLVKSLDPSLGIALTNKHQSGIHPGLTTLFASWPYRTCQFCLDDLALACRWPSTQTTKSRIQLTQWWGYLQCQELNNVFVQQILYRARLKNVCNNLTWLDGVLTPTWLDLETMWLDWEIWKLFTLIIFGKIIFFRQACILFYLCGFPGLCISLNYNDLFPRWAYTLATSRLWPRDSRSQASTLPMEISSIQQAIDCPVYRLPSSAIQQGWCKSYFVMADLACLASRYLNQV